MTGTADGSEPESEVGREPLMNPEDLIDGTAGHAVFALDPAGRITDWPEPARELYGYDAAAVTDRKIGVLFADDAEQDRPVGDLLEEAAHDSVESETWHERADGSVFWATVTLSPLGDGELLGYAVVSHDTTDKKQYERMLERQNDRLKEFTDILAHDLRTPLNVIDGHLKQYRKTGEKEHISTIEETTDRMERLVEDLLRVARQGDVVKDPKPTDLEAVIGDAWLGTGGAADGLTLQYEAVPSVSADADRLRELFENLFRNVVDHGGEGATVSIGPLQDGFYVADDGPGIPADSRDAAFDHGVTTTEDGSGYGLSIVRTIASAHGWDSVVVEADSGGARFEFTGVEFLD
jgi:PAS domain S-box-containing protein